MKAEAEKQRLKPRPMTLIMSHPDREYRLKPLGALPKECSSEEKRDWTGWILELSEGLTMLMFGSQEEAPKFYFGVEKAYDKEPAKTYGTFPLYGKSNCGTLTHAKVLISFDLSFQNPVI